MYNDYLNKNTGNERATPEDFYKKLDAIYKFTLDPCALPENHKCEKYFTPDDNGLVQDWSGNVVFMNPPYGRLIGRWVKKADESGVPVVGLLPARTGGSWFHDHIYKKHPIRFLRGRLKFNGSEVSAPFDSMLVFFNCEDLLPDDFKI